MIGSLSSSSRHGGVVGTVPKLMVQFFLGNCEMRG